MQEPKPYPPTEAEKGVFYEGLSKRKMEKMNAESAKKYNDNKVESQGSSQPLQYNRCSCGYYTQRTSRGKEIPVWPEITGHCPLD